MATPRDIRWLWTARAEDHSVTVAASLRIQKMEVANEGFKIPSIIPQDLLLIQDLIGPIIPPALQVPLVDADDSVDSSGESTDSADEVEANLISVGEKSERSVFMSSQASVYYLTKSLLGKMSLTLSLTRPLPTQTLLQTQTLKVRERMTPQKGHLWNAK